MITGLNLKKSFIKKEGNKLFLDKIENIINKEKNDC